MCTRRPGFLVHGGKLVFPSERPRKRERSLQKSIVRDQSMVIPATRPPSWSPRQERALTVAGHDSGKFFLKLLRSRTGETDESRELPTQYFFHNLPGSFFSSSSRERKEARGEAGGHEGVFRARHVEDENWRTEAGGPGEDSSCNGRRVPGFLREPAFRASFTGRAKKRSVGHGSR